MKGKTQKSKRNDVSISTYTFPIISRDIRKERNKVWVTKILNMYFFV